MPPRSLLQVEDVSRGLLQSLLDQYRRTNFIPGIFPLLLLPAELRRLIYDCLDDLSLKKVSETCSTLRDETENLRFDSLQHFFDFEQHFFVPYCTARMLMHSNAEDDQALKSVGRYHNPYELQAIDLERAKHVRHLRIQHWRPRICSCDGDCAHKLTVNLLKKLFPNLQTLSDQNRTADVSSLHVIGHADPFEVAHAKYVSTRHANVRLMAVPLLPYRLNRVVNYFWRSRKLIAWARCVLYGRIADEDCLMSVDDIHEQCQELRKDLVTSKSSAEQQAVQTEIGDFLEVLKRRSADWSFKTFTESDIPTAEQVMTAMRENRAHV